MEYFSNTNFYFFKSLKTLNRPVTFTRELVTIPSYVRTIYTK